MTNKVLILDSMTAAAANDMLDALATQIDAGGSAGKIQLGNQTNEFDASTFIATVTIALPHPCANAPANGAMTLKSTSITAADGNGATHYQIFDSDDNFICAGQFDDLTMASFVSGQSVRLGQILLRDSKVSGTAVAPPAANPEFPRTWTITLPFSFKTRQLSVTIDVPFLAQADSSHYNPIFLEGNSIDAEWWAPPKGIGTQTSFYFNHGYHAGPLNKTDDTTPQTLTIKTEFSGDGTQIIITADTTSPWLRMRPSSFRGQYITVLIGPEDTTYWNSTLKNAYTPAIVANRPDLGPVSTTGTWVGENLFNSHDQGSFITPRLNSVYQATFHFPFEP
jgi:hypothetical protein